MGGSGHVCPEQSGSWMRKQAVHDVCCHLFLSVTTGDRLGEKGRGGGGGGREEGNACAVTR